VLDFSLVLSKGALHRKRVTLLHSSILALLWGSGFLWIDLVLLNGLSRVQNTVARCALGSLLLLLICQVPYAKLPRDPAHRHRGDLRSGPAQGDPLGLHKRVRVVEPHAYAQPGARCGPRRSTGSDCKWRLLDQADDLRVCRLTKPRRLQVRARLEIV